MVTLPTGPTISCPWLSSPVAVIATYAGLPVAGATVTLFYLGPGAVTTYKSVTTNDIGLAQECIKDWVYVEARIQKTGVNFGSGNGVQHIIGGKSGADRVFSGTFFIVALPCTLPQVYNPITSKCESPAPLPCLGSIKITEPDWTQLISLPSLPGTIPVPFTITADSGARLPDSIPIDIFVDDSRALYLTGKPGDNSIDILSIIKSKLGIAGLSSGHRISLVAKPPDPKCNIPAQGFNLPRLLPPCSGLISIEKPDFTQILSMPSLPGSIPVPVTVTGKSLPASIPLSILVDGTEKTTRTGIRDGSIDIDILSIIRSLPLGAAALKDPHTIDIKSKLPDCDILPAFIEVPALVIGFLKGIISIPSVPKPPKIPYPVKISIDGILAGEPPISKEVDAGLHNITAELKGMTNIYRKISVESGKTTTITDIAFEEILAPCTVWDTTANVYIPSILQLPFNIDISNANWICKATGEKTPVNTTAEVYIGSQKFYIPVWGGAGSLSLTKADIDNIIAGVVTAPTTPTPTAGERVGSYCELRPFVMSGMTFYDVYHDTAGKIYSGNTYDQAKYKAQQDSRCFPTPAVAPCITITIEHNRWSDPKNAYISFYSSKVDNRYAQGSQSWGWGGNPKLTDEEYLQSKAIPRTLDYLGVNFRKLYGRDMLRSDICGQT